MLESTYTNYLTARSIQSEAVNKAVRKYFFCPSNFVNHCIHSIKNTSIETKPHYSSNLEKEN